MAKFRVMLLIASALLLFSDQSEDIKVYPNPFTHKLIIEWPELEYSFITDLAGRRIMESAEHELHLDALTAGIYVLHLSGQGNQLHQLKIIRR